MRALVFGQYSEASPDVHHLLEAAARHLARARWQEFGARCEDECYAATIASYRRRLGVFVSREFARFRLSRAHCVGVEYSRAQLAARRFGPGGQRQEAPQQQQLEGLYRHQARLRMPVD